jgi:hypothetical protein
MTDLKTADFKNVAEKETKKPPLSQTLAIETLAALGAAASVSPFISIIDVAIFPNASGKEKLGTAIISGFKKLAFRPLQFIRHPSFYLIWGVYSGTYIVANYIQAICDYQSIPWFYPKFVGTSAANVSLSVLKDLYLTRAFGKGSPRPVPLRSYGLYTIRDSMTIYASFNLPPMISDHLQTQFGVSKKLASTGSQILTPCLVQFFSSPLHLLGMDLYNRSNVPPSDRLQFIRKEYLKTTLARIGRILPAYGIGGVTNTFFRSLGHDWLHQRHQ